MLLDHIGESAAARQLMQAIETITANPRLHTKDLGGNARTEEVTNAVCALLAQNGAALSLRA
jgi:tartrate dehydrogenase/decarboxylase/D-malate dehydrogenase